MRRCLLTILLVGLASVEAVAQNRDPAFVPGQGAILVNEAPDVVRADVASYAALDATHGLAQAHPDTFRIDLHPQPDGRVALRFPDGFPADDIAGLAAWLGSPCRKPTPPVAAAWIVAQDGAAYYLESEPTLETDQEGEDPRDGCREEGGVLTGASLAGQYVRYDAWRSHLTTAGAGRPYRPEPALPRSDTAVTIRVTRDTDMSYGGNQLVLDPRSEFKRLVDEAIDHCRDLNVVDENAAGGELWFWLQAHRADVSRALWNDAGRAAIAEEKTTATTDVDKACLSRLEREARIGEIIHE